jgi:hypothetical protein
MHVLTIKNLTEMWLQIIVNVEMNIEEEANDQTWKDSSIEEESEKVPIDEKLEDQT